MLISFNQSFHKLNFLGFVTYGIRKGFGLKSFLFFFRALLLLKLYLRHRKLNSFLLLFFVIKRLRPWIHFRISKFRRRRITYVPKILTYRRSIGFAYFWFFKSAKARAGYSVSLKLFLELIYSFKCKSTAIRLRRQAHILSFSYKKNLRRRFGNDRNPLMRLVRVKYALYRRKMATKKKRRVKFFSFRRFLRTRRRMQRFVKKGGFKSVKSRRLLAARLKQFNLKSLNKFDKSAFYKKKRSGPFLFKKDSDFRFSRGGYNQSGRSRFLQKHASSFGFKSSYIKKERKQLSLFGDNLNRFGKARRFFPDGRQKKLTPCIEFKKKSLLKNSVKRVAQNHSFRYGRSLPIYRNYLNLKKK